MNPFYKNLALWLVITLMMIMLYNLFNQQNVVETSIGYSEFLQMVDNGEVEEVIIQGQEITARDTTRTSFKVYAPQDNDLIRRLEQKKVAIKAKPPAENPWYMSVLISWFPMIVLIGVWIFFMRQMQSGGGKAMSFGKSRARLSTDQSEKVTFEDVAGIDEAKEELWEIVEFLKDPKKFTRLGGRIPKGVLLMGPPGTGKTLLGRAIAGEAGVPFFSISGSDFVEMFVGVGASRVRDMFEQAKKNAPCIVFIDEIDAVGRHRGAGYGGGNDEREQTLNQLLVEMDGFEANEGVIIVAATNRKDVLDPALLRPGRFDRQVTVPNPDIKGREKILGVHARKTPLGPDVDLRIIARGTPGFSGADLANLVNEAALMAARVGRRFVTMVDFEDAKDKVMMGAERRSMVMTDDEKRLTAYHEAGHAIVGRLVPGEDPIHKVSIIPRGRALGITLFLPERDRYNFSRQQLESKISSLFGGRIAEQLIFGVEMVTTGASSDIERATQLARNMVTRWGLSERLGPLAYSEDDGEVFLGRSVTRHKNLSDETAHTIDEEIRSVIDRNYLRAEQLLKENMEKLHLMAEALMKYETIDSSQIADIMEGRSPKPPDNTPSTDQTPPGDGSKTVDLGKKGKKGPIGGPAEQP